MAYFVIILKNLARKISINETMRVIWHSSKDGVPFTIHRADRTQRDPSSGATTSTAYRDPDAEQGRQQK